ncbi:putative Oxysterol-binding protein like protein C2F12.05c [Glarea lozoyensis 74030]|uniref:Putative Oxysterol-binding protein like protein C2F12.05c n=1 Tax=Glarea lozoyensis (strain ATCC 74030 / MF5533) TaxID=1104152 RepID=H0EKH0_GLAL7|nr:putative Oxysterol-binding protein like protein C2F12.05c [Glarea lozoyensis 74030]
MSEAGESHKRSKSSAALSMLRKKESKEDGNNTKDSDTSTDQGSTSSHHKHLSLHHHSTKGHSSRPSTGTAGLMRSTSNLNVPRNPMPPPATPQDKGVSIESSVRKFRVFEALRNGDTASISKAIRESDGHRMSTSSATGGGSSGALEDTTILHLAIQCAEQPVIEYILSDGAGSIDINARDKDGNTALHLAAQQGRGQAVKLLLEQDGINDSIANYQGRLPLDLARTPDIFQELQLSRSIFIDGKVRQVQALVQQGDYVRLGEVLEEPRVKTVLDINGGEFCSDITTVQSGGTLLHEAARKKNIALIQVLLLHGADPFRRDRRGKLAQDVTKDDHTRSILKKSPAAVAAQRGIQEKAVLGTASQQLSSAPPGDALAGKEGREMKGYLKKWTNYRKGFQLRWFVLEDGILSYSKHQDDAGSACRGAINMRIARLNMDPSEKTKFDIIGKSSVKYHLKANHEVEAKRWFWALNNSIQWTKDQAKEEEKQRQRSEELLRQAKAEHTNNPSIRETSTADLVPPGSDTASIGDGRRSSFQAGRLIAQATKNSSTSKVAFNTSGSVADDDEGTAYGSYEPSYMGEVSRVPSHMGPGGDGDDDDDYDGSSDREAPATKDALDREQDMRRMWEDSMAQVAKEQEILEARVGEAEEKRRITKRALREVIEGNVPVTSRPVSRGGDGADEGVFGDSFESPDVAAENVASKIKNLSDTESEEDDDEFFDAVDAGEVEVAPMVENPPEYNEKAGTGETLEKSGLDLAPSFRGYEDGIRKRLKMDADDRPKISLWGILKSMIGKDMTKMTLPVSFNEPTSLLQRCAEDMEYADLLDIAASRQDSMERMVYVAAFAASEYASTIGRVAKPFNPLLGETFEYARPDKNYRFFIEQVSHHPPVGAAWAESPRWTYWGESAVKSKFYGKSFDINPLGTWFLRLRPDGSGKEELYTWKKVTSSVIGIITGSPTVDNYGPMEVKNWTTGEVCVIDFKARGWKASSAYQISGRVNDADGKPRYSIGGRWNKKIYARLTPGFEATPEEPKAGQQNHRGSVSDPTQAFLVWEANARPEGIPFNLTPFVVTLNDCNDKLKPWLPPTDTRLRPDQRAMEDGQYDLAATEKNRVEEKQRATRRRREDAGEEFEPKWFHKAQDPTTGEMYWQFNGKYWEEREKAASGEAWRNVEEIF